MKGKNKRNKLKPIMKKSMLAALGLGIALPVAGSLPHALAGAPSPSIEISGPVLNDGIQWLSHSSKDADQSLKPIVVANNTITIDLSTHFPSEKFSGISVVAQNAILTDATDVADVYVNNNNQLVVTPYKSGVINIKLQANYIPNEQLYFINSNSQNIINPEPQQIVTDNIEIDISKRGDLNGDDKVDSADAVKLKDYLSMIARRGPSYVEMNQMDINRDGFVNFEDMSALMQGYASSALGAKDNSYVLSFKEIQDEAIVRNDTIQGAMQLNNTVWSDVEVWNMDKGMKMPLSYKWYTATSTDQSGIDARVLISNATQNSYTIGTEEVGKYLILEVIPDSDLTQSFLIVNKIQVQSPTPYIPPYIPPTIPTYPPVCTPYPPYQPGCPDFYF